MQNKSIQEQIKCNNLQVNLAAVPTCRKYKTDIAGVQLSLSIRYVN